MSLATALEITTDDIENSCYIYFDKKIDWKTADEIMDLIDTDKIQKDALRADSIGEQTVLMLLAIKEDIESNSEVLDILNRT